MATIGSLVVSLEANMAKFTSDMGSAKSTVEDSMGRINSLVDSAKGGVNALADAAKGLGMAFLGIGAGAGLMAIKDQLDGVIASTAKFKQMAEITGASVENLSALGGAAGKTRTDMDSVQAAIVKLDKALSGADDASKGAGHALEFIGLKASDLKAMDPAEALKMIADNLNKFDDKGPGKAAIAIALLGKSSAEMLPFIKALAEQSTLEAKVTGDQAKASDDYQKSLVALTLGKNALYKTIAFELLPAEQQFVDSLLDAKKNAGETKTELQSLIADGSLKQWGMDAANAATGFISGSMSAVKSLGEHRDAVMAVALAYGTWKADLWLAPIVVGAWNAVTANAALAVSFFATRIAQEAAAATTLKEAGAAVIAADAQVAHARATTLANSGAVQLELTTNMLIPALRAQALAQQAAAVAAEEHAVAMRAASVAGMAGEATSIAGAAAMSALGGPIGIITGLLIAGAGAWAIWGNAADKAGQEADKAKNRAEQAIAVMDRMAKTKQFGGGDEGTLRASMEDYESRIAKMAGTNSDEARTKVAGWRIELDKLNAAIYELGTLNAKPPLPAKLSTKGFTSTENKARVGSSSARVGSSSATAMEDPNKAILEEGLKWNERAIKQEDALEKLRSDMLKYYHDQNYLSTDDYYSGMQRLRTDALTDELNHYTNELAAIEVYQSKYDTSSKQWIEAENKRLEILNKMSSAEAKASAESVKQSLEVMAAAKASADAWNNLIDPIRQQASALKISNDERGKTVMQLAQEKLAQLDMAESLTKNQGIYAGLANAQREYIAELQSTSAYQADWKNGLNEALTDYMEKSKDVAGNLKGTFSSGFQGMEKTMSDFLFNPFQNGLKGMIVGFGQMIQRMIADAIAADLMKRLLGGVGTTGSGGWLTSALNFVGMGAGAAASSAGAGGGLASLASSGVLASFAVGSDYVPRDMVAQIHQGERIVPAAQNNADYGNVININVHVNGSSSAPDVRRAAGQGAREALSALNGARRYG